MVVASGPSGGGVWSSMTWEAVIYPTAAVALAQNPGMSRSVIPIACILFDTAANYSHRILVVKYELTEYLVWLRSVQLLLCFCYAGTAHVE